VDVLAETQSVLEGIQVSFQAKFQGSVMSGYLFDENHFTQRTE
jgi:hypothetical protein